MVRPSQIVSDARAEAQQLIREIMARYLVEIGDIGERAKLNPSTIYRWLDPTKTNVPSATSLRKIKAAFDLDGPRSSGRIGGFAERELAKYEGPPLESELKYEDANQTRFVLQSRALDMLGLMQGDIVLVDLKAKPKSGDIAYVQIYSRDGSAETKLRLLRGDFLYTRSLDPTIFETPIYHDGDRVVLKGKLIRSLRRYD
jgi:hypothetical protein